MTVTRSKTLAQELLAAYASGQAIAVPPSARDAAFDLPAAYAVEAELVRLRRASGRTTVGRKVGYANKAIWRVLKLDTLVWAHMYDDTVHYAEDGVASLSLGHMYAPKIEPEIVFKLKRRSRAMRAMRPRFWKPSSGWRLDSRSSIACSPTGSSGPPISWPRSACTRRSIVGEPRRVRAGTIRTRRQLPTFKVRLLKDGKLVAEGSGKNSLRSPALCLGELASAISRQPTRSRWRPESSSAPGR